jgi:hypothetical protein
MNIPVIAILVAAGMVAQVKGEPDARAATVTVYVRIGFGGTDLNPVLAEGIASAMFAQAGVRIQWRKERRKLSQQLYQPNSPIVVDITSYNARSPRPYALAYAQVYGGVHIKVFWDRVKESANCNPALSHKLLAHVLVHEITHVLEGINHHSDEGVMKAQWTNSDIMQMERTPLLFNRHDIELIHEGLKNLAIPLENVHAGR